MTAIIQLLRPVCLVQGRAKGPLCRKQKKKALLKCVITSVSAFLGDVGDIKNEIKENKILECGKQKGRVVYDRHCCSCSFLCLSAARQVV